MSKAKCPAPPDDCTIALAERRADLESDLLAMLLADPRALWPVVHGEGLTADHFGQDDLRLTFKAVAAHHDSRALALEAVVVVLGDAGELADYEGGGFQRWSIPRLVRFSRQHFETVDLLNLTASTAAALVELVERMAKAAALAKEYFALVGEGVAA